MRDKHGLRDGLLREAQCGDGASGFCFPPCVENPVNHGERRDNCNHPKRGRHAVEQSAEDQQDHAFGALHESDLAKRDQGFGARANS